MLAEQTASGQRWQFHDAQQGEACWRSRGSAKPRCTDAFDGKLTFLIPHEWIEAESGDDGMYLHQLPDSRSGVARLFGHQGGRFGPSAEVSVNHSICC